MRVAILTHEFPPYIFGGIGSFIQTLAQALSNEGVEVSVIAGSPERTPKRTRLPGKNTVNIVWLPRGQLPPRHFWFQVRNLNFLKRELVGYDVVHGQDAASFPILQLFKRQNLRIPWVVTIHTSPYSEMHLTLSSIFHGGSLTDLATYAAGFPLWDLTLREHVKWADHLVAVSNHLREELCNTYGADEKRADFIPTCVDILELKKMLDRKIRSNEEIVKLVYAGRLYYRKGISHLMSAVNHLVNVLGVTNFTLEVFGTGPLTRSVKLYVQRNCLGKQVGFRGFVPRKTLIASLSGCDIVCMPSLYEACPVTMIESMAMGKPVVTFNLPFAREMLGEDYAQMASDTADYAVKLAHLIESRDERRRLSKISELMADRFDAREIASQYLRIYNDLSRH